MKTIERTAPVYWWPTLLSIAAIAGLLASGEPRIWQLLGNTAMLGLGACAISIPIGTLAAVLLVRSDLPGRRLIGIAIVVMLFMPLYLQAAGWDAGFGRQGWFSFSQNRIAEPPLSGWTAAIWIHGLAGIPWVVLIVGAALRFVEAEFEELAMLEAPLASVLWRVTLRRCWPAIGVAVIWTLIATAGEMTVTDLYQVRTYAEEIYTTMLDPDIADASVQWMSLVLLVGAMTLVAFVAVFRLAPTTVTTASRPSLQFRLGHFRFPALLFAMSTFGVLVLIPLANLVVNAGVAVRLIDGQLVRQWEFMKFIEMVFPAAARFSEEFTWTFLIGATAATVTVAIAVPITWLARRRLWAFVLSLAVASICLATPGPLIGLTLIWLLNGDSDFLFWLYDRTIFAPAAAMVVRSLPLAILISWYALRSIATDVLEAAATDGAGPAQRLWRVAAPQRLGAFAAIWLAALAIAMGDLAATKLVTPPGINTVAVRVFGLLHAGVDDSVAGLCLTIFFVFFVIALLVVYASRPLFALRERRFGEYN